ncbi:helix-turn-helix domain-containing protein [Duganella lactea]|uniref:helix-turn-helix domain-containing protein n=1 Tax=Duganella lactea TaxID=2692173 RepID=UPI0019284FC7|nr:helix-turn-helix domain-containing protein [Duganella lactea]
MHITLLFADQCAAASATTHWAFAELFRKRYPDVRMDERQNLCEDNRLMTSGGASAAMELITLRLEKAKHLLESTRMSLDSITFKVGYADSNSFRRLFQQRVGLLPAAYRKKFQPA